MNSSKRPKRIILIYQGFNKIYSSIKKAHEDASIITGKPISHKMLSDALNSESGKVNTTYELFVDEA